ncbi:MAG TPA: hypothetical protein VGD45_14205 [Steroidobacter sp.]|uniref:hypothetical protein n=1 Tax=Steroidobacter sp. TaxID=1978227 RepID=UPI002ED77F95
MSADILFVKRPPLLPKWLARLRGVLGNSGVIGSTESVKAELYELFPQTRWRLQTLPIPLPGAAAGADPWVSNGPPELQFFAENDGSVRLLFASRIEPEEIRRLEKRLRVVAINMQADGFREMLFS